MVKRKKEIDTKDQPWVSNYPPLREWLDKHNARCQWQLSMGNAGRDYPVGYVEQWSVGKGLVIIVVHAKQHGWEIYSALDSLDIKESLADAEKRCGVA